MCSAHAAPAANATAPVARRLYATYFRAVQTDFELSLRRTPMPLARIRAEVCAAAPPLATAAPLSLPPVHLLPAPNAAPPACPPAARTPSSGGRLRRDAPPRWACRRTRPPRRRPCTPTSPASPAQRCTRAHARLGCQHGRGAGGEAPLECQHTHTHAAAVLQEMLRRGEAQGVAPISWQELGGDLVAFSHGRQPRWGCG